MVKKAVRTCPTIIIVFLLFFTLLIEFSTIYRLHGRIDFLYIYDNYSDSAEETTATIYVYTHNDLSGYALWYKYVDDDGEEYTGVYKDVKYLETAQNSIGTEIKIKIYDGRSWPSEMGRPNLTGEIIILIALTPLNIFLLTLLFLKIKHRKAFTEEKHEV